MKAKLFLGLAVCCFLVSLGLIVGLAIKGVQAQSTPGPWPQQPLFVKFAEDFMRQHGREVVSVCKDVNSDEWTTFIPLNETKKFVVTDIVCIYSEAVLSGVFCNIV